MITAPNTAAFDVATMRAAQAGAPPTAAIPAKVREAAQQFEASFLSQMLSHMFEGVGEDPMFGGGKGEEVFKSFLVDEYGKSVARAGGLGLADAVQKEMLRMQEQRA
jgi:peptidoglycan hydrolase FlgJ